MITCPTFPARPINGGPLDRAPAKSGHWCYEPKYNGWRALVHVPSGTMFNRHGERLSIQHEFTIALDKLRQATPTGLEWLDCEALERRHNIGRGSLIILDSIGGTNESPCYEQRRLRFELLSELSVHQDLNQPIANDAVYLVASYPGKNRQAFEAERQELHLWDILKQCNAALKCEFYEGLVAKRLDSKYPIQLRNSKEDFPFWVKHRWAF